MVVTIRTLSKRYRKGRDTCAFFGIKELPAYILKNLTHPDLLLSYALIVVVADGDDDIEVGVGRYAPTEKHRIAELSVVVADEDQGQAIAAGSHYSRRCRCDMSIGLRV